MAKIVNNKYYTPVWLAEKLTQKTFDVIGRLNVTEVIEPSAGNGAFSNLFWNGCKAYDIEPEGDNILEQDYLTLEEEYKEGRLYLGNPPFGDRNYLSLKFLKKNMLYGDYIAYIQPILSLNGSLQFYEFDLIHSEDLGIVDFSGVKLHCCFNIWKRPESGILNKKPDYKLKSVVIKEYRRNKKNDNDHSCYNVESITNGYDYAMCNWGSGTLGKQPEYVGQYAQEVYFYLNDKSRLPELKELLEYDTIRSYCKNISMKRICVARIYQYLKENGFD